MASLVSYIIEYPWGWQEVYATSKRNAEEQATSEPILWVGTRNQWNERRDA